MWYCFMFIYRLVAWRMEELHANFSRIFHTTLTHCISISITITKSDCNCLSYKARLKCYQLDVRSHSGVAVMGGMRRWEMKRYCPVISVLSLSCYPHWSPLWSPQWDRSMLSWDIIGLVTATPLAVTRGERERGKLKCYNPFQQLV